MSSPSPNETNRVHVPDDRGMRRNMTDWRPSRRTLLVLGAAFAIGLLLFLLMWWRDRGQDFYRADTAPAATSEQQFEPLPAPLPADAGNRDSRLGEPAEDDTSPAMGRIEPPPAPPRAPEQPRAPSPSPPVNAGPAPGATPVAISSPAPSYPPDAYRKGESGTVVLRIHVGPDGIPYSVDLVQSSRSRSLDRAASDAVRRWRFRPAQRGGQPVAGEVQVPIVFTADR
ncbi:energy transducer TonB [Cognatiluteimonas profundi]|uniref:energy transducer TonB n=1 Tax=Cognatiluteimonas profundi TaxID=2594501 RepID=UPI001E431D91|nr:energy transducer TonB [Lysobacter profundi]